MFRLFKMAGYGLMFAVLAYFGLTVPLGDHTLFQHVLRIAGTEEAQDFKQALGQAGAQAVRDVSDNIRHADNVATPNQKNPTASGSSATPGQTPNQQ